jgi:hypothetical protein
LDDVYQNHFETMAVIHYHAWWPSGSDPYYLANPGENSARINYYGADYTPHAWIDGNIDGGSNSAIWNSQVTGEESVPSPLAIGLTADYGTEGDYGTITAVIDATAPITETNLRTRIAIVEHHLPGIGGFDEFNHVMRDMLPDAMGQDLTISEGEQVTQQVTYVLSRDWNFAQLDIIAFVQSDAGHRILQAARLRPPSGTLRGVVTNAESGFPVPNAEVRILNTTYGDDSDSQGNYEFAFLPGDRSLVVGAPGFEPDTLSVFIAVNDTTDFDIALTPGATSSISGTITDPSGGGPIAADVTLYMNDEPLATVQTDPGTGAYAFTGINVSSPPWVVYTGIVIAPSIPYPVTTHAETIDVQEGVPTLLDFDIEPAGVFLVDDDEGKAYEAYFKDEINAAGRTFYHYDVNAAGESAVNSLKLFPTSTVVLWFTGDATSETITATEQDSLAKLLDRGGRVFLTGQNIAEDLDATGSTFLSDYLHTAYDGRVTYFMGKGVWGNPVTGYLDLFVSTGAGGANNQTSRDLLVPSAPAEEFIYYVQSPADLTPKGTAAIAVEGTGGSKAVLMGFGLEALNRTGDDSSRATREEALLAILNWFDGITGIGDDGPGGGISVPRTFALEQNYPNPFNPSTTIRYAIPADMASTPVRLDLYDLRGRLVRTLIDGEQAAGTHAVHWDGRDGRGAAVGSGVYIYRLRAGERVLTRKMSIVR